MSGRVRADGRHLWLDDAPFRVRGVTYGTFAPRLDGQPYPDPTDVKKDFLAMAQAGLNVVRTYTVPPRDVLEAAEDAGLRLIVGLDYEDWRSYARVGRATDRRVADSGRRAVDAAMRAVAGDGTVLAVSVGNEVPGDIVRLHGVGTIEEVLTLLVRHVHEADPEMLATYTNYPTTEYLRVEEQDLCSFNVFLEEHTELRKYLTRLQRISPGIPVVLTELGLAAEVHGPARQASSLDRQLRAVDEAGCAGATVFSWTDEWAVGGRAVQGWGFGITDIDRRPKPALDVVGRWARTSVRDLLGTWPSISVVVCAYNEERRIGECLRSLAGCDYPELDVIVCDDGSSDRTAEISRGFPFRLLELPHAGLSVARNAGIAAARGEIVAFLDADAVCHPHWPYHLALSLKGRDVAGTGGPNLPVSGGGLIERAVASSPGGPAEVLISDDRAEHVPGCNMAFRREALTVLNGFDPMFTAAGDDVDLCWRLLDRGWQIGFSSAAQVRHHRRDTVRGYLRQQVGYGRAERLVAPRHPHRFNGVGQARWVGSIYGGGVMSFLRPVVYHGPRALAAYQSRMPRPAGRAVDGLAHLLPLALAPALVMTLLAIVSAWFLAVAMLLWILILGYASLVVIGCRTARDEPHPIAFRLLVGLLHVAQPNARLWGRIGVGRPAPPPAAEAAAWSGDREAWLIGLERDLRARGCRVSDGGPTGRADLLVSVGPLIRGRLTAAVAWRWIPRTRFTLWPSSFAFATLAGAIALVALAGPWLWPVLPALAAGGASEAMRLRERVARSVRFTTEGS